MFDFFFQNDENQRVLLVVLRIGRLCVAKRTWRQRPVHVHLERAFTILRRFYIIYYLFIYFSFLEGGALKRVCFYRCLVIFEKHQDFSSQMNDWLPTVWSSFSFLDEMTRMRVRVARKIFKIQLAL